jgi:hypothetical protein
MAHVNPDEMRNERISLGHLLGRHESARTGAVVGWTAVFLTRADAVRRLPLSLQCIRS